MIEGGELAHDKCAEEKDEEPPYRWHHTGGRHRKAAGLQPFSP
jgi:hypothetical protein